MKVNEGVREYKPGSGSSDRPWNLSWEGREASKKTVGSMVWWSLRERTVQEEAVE